MFIDAVRRYRDRVTDPELQKAVTAFIGQDIAHEKRRAGHYGRRGGSIISSTPEANRTCFEILGRELDSSARPRGEDYDLGRFLACRQGFQDPAVFREGREVTVVGRIVELTTREIGEFEYRYRFGGHHGFRRGHHPGFHHRPLLPLRRL